MIRAKRRRSILYPTCTLWRIWSPTCPTSTRSTDPSSLIWRRRTWRRRTLAKWLTNKAWRTVQSWTACMSAFCAHVVAPHVPPIGGMLTVTWDPLFCCKPTGNLSLFNCLMIGFRKCTTLINFRIFPLISIILNFHHTRYITK